MRILFPIVAFGFLQACGGPGGLTAGGTDMYAYFPFDGQRDWTYISTDIETSYRLDAAMRSLEPEVVNGVNAYPVDYSIDCVQDDEECVDGPLRTLLWSSTQNGGVAIHSWEEFGKPPIDFDPPLQVAAAEMFLGDVVVTETGGATWTSTLEAFEGCPDRYATDLGSCAKITIDDGDGDSQTGLGLTGSYWAVPGFNVVGIEFVGEEAQWQLSENDCLPDEECDGFW